MIFPHAAPDHTKILCCNWSAILSAASFSLNLLEEAYKRQQEQEHSWELAKEERLQHQLEEREHKHQLEERERSWRSGSVKQLEERERHSDNAC